MPFGQLRRVPRVRLALGLCLSLIGIVLGLLGTPSDAQEVLTNQSIIGMVKAGFSESVIIAKIRASTGKFDTSTDALLKLKAEKVPDKVIEAMIGGGAPAAAAAPAATATATGDPTVAYVSPNGPVPLKA